MRKLKRYWPGYPDCYYWFDLSMVVFIESPAAYPGVAAFRLRGSDLLYYVETEADVLAEMVLKAKL